MMEALHWEGSSGGWSEQAVVAAPLMAVAMIIAVVRAPREVAESDTASGCGLWLVQRWGLHWR